MSEAEVLFERRGSVGLITLNRPKALNALTHDMCLRMKAQLDMWADDPSIDSVVVRGAGDRAFCAGGDIRALYESGKAGTPYVLDFYRDEYILNATIKHYPKPYIAMIHGIVMGGGVGVSVHGRYRVAEETITFAMPETGIGLFPDVGGSYFLPRTPGEIGMYLALTGTRLKAADCLYAGVATHVVPPGRSTVLIDCLEIGRPPEEEFSPYGRIEGRAPLDVQRAWIDEVFSGTTVEAILASLDSHGTQWAAETAKTIRSKSPTATKIAFRQIREGKKLDFDDCMRMEYRLVNRVVAGKDFYEGVRATIIDKDQSPKWQPARLEDVSDKDIDAYFAPLGDRELKL
ncbi:MAG TPA: enoyl-CoA hydratase/isomerase family protein [Rhizomicrobium sp.]|nr:enoyl-CoA hydratase/isomerase family protein [Rhizomicrobium sp.]